MTENLRGKTAFLTGGSSGITLAIAEHFASLGMNIALLARNPDRLAEAQAAVEAHGAECLIFPADVRNIDDMTSAMAQTADRFGSIDTVVAGAAGNFVAPAKDLTSNGFKSVMDIDTLGMFNTASAALPHLTKPGGSVIAISAPQTVVPYAGQIHVSAAKAGIEMALKTLAIEWGPMGIRTVGISPGPIADTEGLERVAPTKEAKAFVEHRTPVRRLGQKSDIAPDFIGFRR